MEDSKSITPQGDDKTIFTVSCQGSSSDLVERKQAHRVLTPDFSDSLSSVIKRIQTGDISWLSYDEVFKENDFNTY